MSTRVANPIIRKIEDTQDALDFFESVTLPAEDEKTQDIIMNFPTVYIHSWQESCDFEVYVGETNDIFRRTREHYGAASDKKAWQSKLSEKDASLFIIGHEHFNKSLTLDIENRLMHYMMSIDRVKHVHNGRGNPQSSYYPVEELDVIFRSIWRGLRRENKELFPTESSIKDSAIYKASPLHKLTKEQENARDLIIQKVKRALEKNETKQLIFIEGEAGTGKTVLNSSTFYELYCRAEEDKKELDCHLLVNHDEQITVYEQIAEKLGLTDKYGKVVSKPTSFINNHTEDDSPELLDKEIKKRAGESDSALSRVIATYDWEYSSNKKPEARLMKYWEVLIGKWHKPWNRELESELSKKEKRAIKGLAWAEQPQTIDEVGSTFTIQGFDLNYAGVILGPSVKYRNGKIIFDPSASHNSKAVRNRTLSDGTKKKFGEMLIQHEVRVLMTRGVNGMYIYACDPELQAELIKASK